jgi:DnaJ-class molecular chaperone with C-terminal Zn finger domain
VADPADPADPYKILQVDPEAEDEVIQAAYRRLARKYHPDLAQGPEAAARMAAINAAWDRLGDPIARATHDRERALRQAHAAEIARRASSNSRAGPDAADRSAPGSRTRSMSERPPEEASRDWTSGRSGHGGGHDDSIRTAEGLGAAGPPPGNPSGSVLNFGRYAGWSLGEIARHDLEYVEWLDRTPIGRPYRAEVDAILRQTGRRRSAEAEAADRRGLFRRR